MKQQYRYICAGILLFFLFLFEIIIDTLATAPCILDCIETYSTGTYWEKNKRKCFLLTLSDHRYFLRISKVTCYIMSKLGKFRVNNATLCLYIHFWHFLFFSTKNLFLIIFISFFSFFFSFFFYEVPSFCNRRLSHQKLELVIINCQLNCMTRNV